ncbi:MFS transporter [Vibrio tubiashii]|uniref:MFS transporter n=1 Tax=Vibrio tubiashii TaxID=29498 RepID=UPI001EFE70AC|nr:MFS transporter [Vibrio tubiashii]MCG9615960.1 MFS transporter [Vibrio tubiashii]MCG9689831.1 MFS transporter [Vibrio tubiashii]
MYSVPNWLVASIKLAISAAVFSILPLFMTTLSEHIPLTSIQLNMVATIELMGFAMACGVNYYTSKKGFKYNDNFALAALSLCHLFSALASDLPLFFLLRALAGVFAGLVVVRSYDVLGREVNADAAFGKAIAIQMLATALLFLTLPYWLQTYGASSMFFILSALVALCLLFKPLRASDVDLSPSTSELDYSLVFLSLGAVAMVMMTHSAVWSTLGFYASSRQISVDAQGYIFSIGTLFSVVGALLATLEVVHHKKSKLLPLAIGFQCIVVWVLIADSSVLRFITATFFFQLLWNFMLPLVLGSIAAGKHARTIIGFVLVAQTFGAALGPVMLVSDWVLPELLTMLLVTQFLVSSLVKPKPI